jgi:hypothetical protein
LALPYIKPGVSVSEIVSPQLTPVLLDPNVIAIVAPARGYEEHVETFVLSDNAPVTLSANGVDASTVVVRDASDITLAPFTPTTYEATPGVDDLQDYDVDTSLALTTGETSVVRSMQTLIGNGEQVVVYYETAVGGVQAQSNTVWPTLNMLTPVTVGQASLETASVLVTKQGLLVDGVDVTITNEGLANASIAWDNGSTIVGEFQDIYLDFDVAGTVYLDQPIQLNGLAAVDIGPAADNIVVKNAPGSFTTNAVLYAKSTLEEADYGTAGTGAAFAVRRSQGSTTIGGANDQLTVRVSYRATPTDYYLPTRCYSQGDVENKFGAAFDSAGNVQNPLSLAALFAFQNGASQVVAQALFGGTLAAPAAPTGTLANWELSFERLRSVTDVSMLVPVISSGNLNTAPSDSLSLSILQAAQTHARYMAAQENQFLLVIAGEDGTGNTLATPTVLQSHASSLGQGANSESVMLLAPSAFTFGNPVTGANSDVGGQYVAAAAAGLAARYPTQMPLTRKRIGGLTSIKTARTETQKDQDAQSGLAVVENKRGRIQIRHSITTNQSTRAQQEFSVVRSKYWMMKNLVEALDTQAVGQLILDSEANFLIQVLVASELELLTNQGAIAEYGDIQVRPDPADATALQVRFTYRPSYPLNRVAITFSITAESGVQFEQSTTTQGF